MAQNWTIALIVGRSDPLRSGLQALMEAIPQIEIVGEANGVATVRGMIAGHCPDLVLLDANLPGNEALVTVRQIRTACPQTCCIVLANDVEQQQEAEAAGADIVLLKGFPAAQLVTTIERMFV